MSKPLVLAALLSLGLSSCSIGGGITEQIPTQGQELLDLKRALDAGAINDEEYQKLKREILNGNRG